MAHVDLSRIEVWEEPGALEDLASAVSADADAFVSDLESAAKTWGGLGSAYRAPKAELLWNALDLPRASGVVCEGAGQLIMKALGDFASELRALIAERTLLQGEVKTFNTLWAGLDARTIPVEAQEEQTRLMGACSDLAARYEQHASTCATTLTGITTQNAAQFTTLSLLGFQPWPGWLSSNTAKLTALFGTDILQRPVTRTVITQLVTTQTTTRLLPWLAAEDDLAMVRRRVPLLGRPLAWLGQTVSDVLLTWPGLPKTDTRISTATVSGRTGPGRTPLFDFPPELLDPSGDLSAWQRWARRFKVAGLDALKSNVPIYGPLRDLSDAVSSSTLSTGPKIPLPDSPPETTTTSNWLRSVDSTTTVTGNKQVSHGVEVAAKYSKLAKGIGTLGVVGDLVGAGFTYTDEYNSQLQEELQRNPAISQEQASRQATEAAVVRTAAKTGTGVLTTAVATAVAGSVVPGLGTAAGFAIGLAAGIATEIDFLPDGNGGKQSISDAAAGLVEDLWHRMPWG